MSANSKQDVPLHIPGPHTCNSVGSNVIKLVGSLLEQSCDQNGGVLTKDDITRILQDLTGSTHMFPLFENTYSTCVETRKKFKGGTLNSETMPRFVAIALLKDVLQSTFSTTTQSTEHTWQRVFIDTLIKYVDQRCGTRIFYSLAQSYKILAAEHGNALTSADLLKDPSIQRICVQLITHMEELHLHGPEELSEMEGTINQALATQHCSDGKPLQKVDTGTLSIFLDRACRPSEENKFRRHIMTQTELT